MNCRYCGALNTEHDHRCVRCGRRLYLPSVRPDPESMPVSSRGSTVPAMQPEQSPAWQQMHSAMSEPRQESLFPQGAGTRDRLRVVEMPPSLRREGALRASATVGATRTNVSRENQQRLAFPQQSADQVLSQDSTIYCDAPVALPVHRVMAAMLDGSMMLISLGIFLVIFHIAGAQIVLNKLTLPLYLGAALATLTLYRLLWCLADTDSIGMRWSGLRLITFDGVAPARQQRFYRLLTANLSLAAGGLGLLWGLVDEEQLTWHDHMSKTFPTPRARLLRYPQR